VLDAAPGDGPPDNSRTGRVTVSVVAGSDDIDVLLFLGEPEAPAGRVLTTGLAAVGQESPGTAAAELTGEHPGPGITVGTIRSTSDRPITTLDTIRFTIRSEHDLLAEPELFGLKAASDPSTAGFSGISDTALYVSSANQDAMAQFSATGFEAAAVTVVSMSRTAMMRTREFDVRHTTVTYDRPFGFAAVHRTSGLILVAGWVANPE
jgi:Serpin (serine protease inhibitor)